MRGSGKQVLAVEASTVSQEEGNEYYGMGRQLAVPDLCLALVSLQGIWTYVGTLRPLVGKS